MNLSRPVLQEAAYVDGPSGSRFRIVSQPAEGPCLGTVIWVHAFAEEMNKTRRMSARMARMLASAGWRVVQRDLRGCGDSEGDFADASWDAWVDDVKAEIQSADGRGPVWLWCVRAGALLASAALVGRAGVDLLLWQPVLSGAQHLQQFLRLHTGARILGSVKGTSDSTPAQLLRAGTAVEVGGYMVAPALALGLEKASFDVPADFTGRIAWFELSSDETPSVSLVATRTVDRLRACGVDVDIDALTGPAFWQTQEIEESETLLLRSFLAIAGSDPEIRGEPGSVHMARAKEGDQGKGTPQEQAVGFRCGDAQLWGVLARAPSQHAAASTAVVIAVGGPQYRVGSHRQFVMLARSLAERGYTSLRFDYRGMGDSEGERRTFEDVGSDLHAAVDALQLACPEARQVVVWGLCDAASAAMMYGGSHSAVAGIVAANPWARSDASLAVTQVKHYYLARMVSPEFWAKLLRGRLDVRDSICALSRILKQAWGGSRSTDSPSRGDNSFQSRMARGIAGFRGRTLLVMAGNDLTAKEFLQYTGKAPPWRGLLDADRVSRVDLPESDHTFSTRVWSKQVEDATVTWLQSLEGEPVPTQGRE